jgi:N-acetyl-gamma-glutamyl-phosphate reductase
MYKAGTEHAHVPEIERYLSRLAGEPVQLGFAPQVVPMSRGILLTASAPLKDPLSADTVRESYAAHYGSEPFVRVLGADQCPETSRVSGSNRCDVWATTIHGGRTLLAVAALDNLVKGAAGQAIQNINLMCGWPEDQGLPKDGRPW